MSLRTLFIFVVLGVLWFGILFRFPLWLNLVFLGVIAGFAGSQLSSRSSSKTVIRSPPRNRRRDYF